MKGGANVLSALVELHAKERRLAALLHGKCWWEELAPCHTTHFVYPH